MGNFPHQRPDWANLQVLHHGTLAPRADFYLYDTEDDALARDVSKARCQPLAGTWKFNLANSPFEAPEGFEAESFDSSKWSDITVPGMWQLQGFGRGPQYTNVQFPFFVDPPCPPYKDNECGSYITRFHIPKHLQEDQLRLRFEGVDSAFHVWLNGREVGYSQGARNPSEFDVSGFVKKIDENVLAVRVYQFCDGSYIEDQDQWWLSGIFRDVFLLSFPTGARIEDINLQTMLDDEYTNATLQVQVDISGIGVIDLKLRDASGDEVASAKQSKTTPARQTIDFAVSVDNPHKWTAETPYLYDLVLSVDGSLFTAHRVGFRQVELKDGLIKVNGQRVVFKGANRHEHHPSYGRTIPLDFLKQDLLLMKKHNINAIRTCHQPSDPRLYDLADELGFWVMDEADLECHGFETVEDAALGPEQRALPFFERQQLTRGNAAKWTSDKPDWHDAYIDRAKQVVHRDKLHPSVIIWSLGNEAFYGRNHTAMRDWIKSFDSTRLIHYEPDINAEHTDMYSRMYPHIDSIIAFAEDKSKTKPLVLCEYIHAMGTGPGNIKEYVDAFYKYSKLQGGWVWEWANHGLLTHNKDGDEYYAYGGDFEDVPNDYNFVMDGVLNSDHTPNSGLIEYKEALEPVQLVSMSPDQYTATFISRYDFANLDHLVCIFSVASESGGTRATGQAFIPQGVQPGAAFDMTVPKVTPDRDGEAFMDFSFKLKEDTAWAVAGHEVAWTQVALHHPEDVGMMKPSKAAVSDVTVKQFGEALIVAAAQCEWELDLVRGNLTSWKRNGKQLMSAPLEPSFYRAPTDNDTPQDGADWKDRMLHLATIHTRSVEWHGHSDRVVVKMTQKFAPPVLSWSLDLETEYTFDTSGSISINVKGKPTGQNLPKTLPRIGLILGLTNDLQKLDWFGRGPGESYRDMKLSQRIGWHSASSIDELWTGPDFPQECSNRTDTRRLKLSSPDGAEFTAQFFEPGDPEKRRLFDFMASHYDVEDIEEAQHPFELEKRKKDYVVLRLGAEHHGLGTGSCGPKTLEQYALKTGEFEFGVLLY